MKIILFVYVFALFIILAPNIFIPYDKQFGSLVHSIFFITIFYFTYEMIIKEGFSEKQLTMKGLSRLGDLFQKNRGETDSTTVIIDNKIRKPTQKEVSL